MMKRRVLFLLGFLVLALALPVLLPAGAEAAGEQPLADIVMNPWRGMRPATCMPDRCFCEGVGAGVIRQPINTWSNLGFVLVGLGTLAVAVRDFTLVPPTKSGSLMQQMWVYPVVYGIATILIGIGSMLYHSSLAFVWQTVDVTSIYLLASFMLLYNVSRLRQLKGGLFATSYVLINVALGYLAIRWPHTRRYIFLALVCAVLVSEWLVHRRRRPKMKMVYLGAAIGSLVAACLAWLIDLVAVANLGGASCATGGWLQGHALWHILMAVLIGFVYVYFRSEEGE
jgi:hypothetical protein